MEKIMDQVRQLQQPSKYVDPAGQSCWSTCSDADCDGQTLMTTPTDIQASNFSESDAFGMDEVELVDAGSSERYFEILNRPSNFDLEHDKIRIRGWKQERSNAHLAQHMQHVSRQDHHIMLRILIGQAYFKDPEHKENRKKWCKVLSSMSNKFDGAAAILSWSASADPYNDIIGALSRMRLWSDSQRKWDFNAPCQLQTHEMSKLLPLRLPAHRTRTEFGPLSVGNGRQAAEPIQAEKQKRDNPCTFMCTYLFILKSNVVV
eukprot:gene6063-4362_t